MRQKLTKPTQVRAGSNTSDRPHQDQEIDTYLRYKSLARKNYFWSFAIRQRINGYQIGTLFLQVKYYLEELKIYEHQKGFSINDDPKIHLE